MSIIYNMVRIYRVSLNTLNQSYFVRKVSYCLSVNVLNNPRSTGVFINLFYQNSIATWRRGNYFIRILISVDSTFIKKKIEPGDEFFCELDAFWMLQNRSRYSVAVIDSRGRKVNFKF